MLCTLIPKVQVLHCESNLICGHQKQSILSTTGFDAVGNMNDNMSPNVVSYRTMYLP